MDIDVTPIHFYETVKLLKTRDFSIGFDDRSLLVSFKVYPFEVETGKRDREIQIEHFYSFLKELSSCSVPTDLSDFVNRYKPFNSSFRRRKSAKK